MDIGIVKTKMPEERELESKQAEFSLLENKLLEKELYLHTLESKLAAFEHQYYKIVGTRLAFLDTLEAEIAELLAQLYPQDVEVEKQAQEARKRADDSRRTANKYENLPGQAEQFSPSEDLKMLYRNLAKLVHPDFALDEDDRNRRNRIMADVNSAYRSGDETNLRRILDELAAAPELITGQGIGYELIRIIRKIAIANARLQKLDSEIEDLEKTDLYQLMLQVQIAEQHGKDLLAQMAAQIDRKTIYRTKELDRLKNH